MSRVAELFITPLLVQFTLPDGARGHRDAFFEQYTLALSTFRAEVLQAAANKFLEKAESRAFPMIAECKRMCVQVSAEMDASRAVVRDGEPLSRYVAAEAYKKLLKQVGAENTRDLLMAYGKFIRAHNRVTTTDEFQALIAQTQRNRAA